MIRPGFSTGVTTTTPCVSHVHRGDTAPRNDQGRELFCARRDRRDRDAGDDRNDAESQTRITLVRRFRHRTLARRNPFGHRGIDPLLHLPVKPGQEVVEHRVLVVWAELPARTNGRGQIVACRPSVLGHLARIEPSWRCPPVLPCSGTASLSARFRLGTHETRPTLSVGDADGVDRSV
jgi:hypothetical protein